MNPDFGQRLRAVCTDIAHAVCYLASDDAEWMIGVLLPVDGGATVAR